jgi:hypothetical protein
MKKSTPDLMDATDIGEALVFVGGLIEMASVGTIVWQVYTFLSDGTWHWITLADLVVRSGNAPQWLISPPEQWQWVGIGKFVNWAFYSAAASGIGLAIGAAMYFIGLFLQLQPWSRSNND